ncbi:MAG TPA: restriction endonuclease subunit S [Ignavibacteria bacterium]|nr:restriction endonuclease subunit S [Ignavibacteria bacterium]
MDSLPKLTKISVVESVLNKFLVIGYGNLLFVRMVLKKKLSELFSIMTGLNLRPEKNGDIIYLQSQNFDENGILKSKLMPEVSRMNVNEQYILRPDDIIFAAKGSKNFAALFEKRNDPAVPSTTFFILRKKSHNVNLKSEFVVWYLNQTQTQIKLKKYITGSSIQSLTKKELGNIYISIPEFKIQELILKIETKIKELNQLNSKLTNLRNKFNQQKFNLQKLSIKVID